MANTLTNLIPTIYEAMDVVSRELVGLVPAVSLSASAERAAKDQTITAHIAPAATASDIAPAVTPPNDGDQTIGNVQMTISKARRVPVRWNGEESKSLEAPGGLGRAPIMRDQFAQAFRTLANEVEADLATLVNGFSRAAGTQGTQPFTFSATKSGFEEVAAVRQILVDNGAPQSDLQLVLSTGHGARLRSLAQLNNAQATQGGVAFQQQGILLPMHGLDLRESGKLGLTVFTKGTNNGAASTNNAGYAVGATTITLASAGTGTIIAGDIITFAGDPNQYVVATGDADVSNGGTITLVEPGLRLAIPASNTVITTIGNTARSAGFHRSAIVLATRLPARPAEGDSAADVTQVVDPKSGLVFEVSMYKQYRQVQYEVAIAWGYKLVAPRHTALLIS